MEAKIATIASLESQNQVLTGKVTELQEILVRLQQEANPTFVPATQI